MVARLNQAALVALLGFLLLGGACNPTARTLLGERLKKGSPNPFLGLWMGLSGEGADLYNHSIIRNWRGTSDCHPRCPKVDVWKYRFKDPNSQIEMQGKKAFATQKQYWRVSFEARIIATVLFGTQRRFVDGLRNFLKSNDSLKRVNHISDTHWGFETFTTRVYVPMRNPMNGSNRSPIRGTVPEDFIQELLDLGCEVAYVDNGRDVVELDATFWRFMVASEEMPNDQRIRYLVRDVDWLLTAPEAIAVGEWINSGKQFHRMQIHPICISPIGAGIWAGTHVGRGSIPDIKEYIERYPYRFMYGDDEMFLRDIVWPQFLDSGSIMSHHYTEGAFTFFGNPYAESCKRPTQLYCDEMKAGGSCEDRIIPDDTPFPFIEFGGFENSQRFLLQDKPFDMHIEKERTKKAIKGLSINPEFRN